MDADKLDHWHWLSTNSLANNKKDNQLFYCSNRRLNQGVLIPDGRVSLCCHDYSLKYFKGDLKNSKLSSIYENKEIYEKNQDFINGKYNPCKSCEFYESLWEKKFAYLHHLDQSTEF